MWIRNLRHSIFVELFLVSLLCAALVACEDVTDNNDPPSEDAVSVEDNSSPAVDMGGPSSNCPEAREGECEEKTIWAADMESGECCEYNGFCKSPDGWEQYKDMETCVASLNPPSAACPPPLDNECEEKVFWAKNPDSGDCCQYARPCTTPDGWEKFKDIQTCEEPSSTGAQCPLALEAECEEKVVWGLDADNNVCCEYAGFCMIPDDLEQYKDAATCEGELVQVSPADCPNEEKPGECEEKTIWAKNNSTGTCCAFSGFCHAPDGWETYKDPETCEADTE
jgi:hypothetical protein